jgi:hypothetical protein
VFNTTDIINFGREITAHGEKWQSVQTLHAGYHLAIKADQPLPAQCFVIKEDEAVKPSTTDNSTPL